MVFIDLLLMPTSGMLLRRVTSAGGISTAEGKCYHGVMVKVLLYVGNAVPAIFHNVNERPCKLHHVGYSINGRCVGSLPMSRFNSVCSALLVRIYGITSLWCYLREDRRKKRFESATSITLTEVYLSKSITVDGQLKEIV